ncbi:MAG: helix-turn-helix transcriptional regulator [Clostridia bacterium]|nr:helix-turn-helix transcriptional regulator [Clostridia bacterium]
MNITQVVGNHVCILRKSNHMSQSQLANILGVTKQAVSKWECGLCAPDLSVLVHIARIFGVTVDCLLGMKSDNE